VAAVNEPRPRAVWGCASLGLAGSLLVAVAAPRAVADDVVGWWYHPALPGGRSFAVACVFVGIGAVCVAWLALGFAAAPSRRAITAIAVAWLAPLVLAPPLFSRDLYSYLAQGTILHLGLNPYHTAPRALAGLGRGHVLAAVSPFWRGTTAPYGPLFLSLIALIVSVTGSHLIAGVLLARALELAGLGLLALALPRVCRCVGGDTQRALWLIVLNPLTLFQLLAAGHNDLLMMGVLVIGIGAALEGRPLRGVAVCALAATIKLPALAGVAFIVAAWCWGEDSRAGALRLAASASAITAGVLAIVTIAAGVGPGWISTSLFATPARVHLAITPATAVGYTAASLLHDLGLTVSARGLENALVVIAFALTAVLALVGLLRVRVPTLVPWLGGVLLVAAAGGPAAWPWYFGWGLAVVAADPRAQRRCLLAAGCVAGALVVKPSGILALSLGTAPAVLLVYVLAGLIPWRWRARSVPRPAPGRV
jgi:alpha-1,6-mannosyltransferase